MIRVEREGIESVDSHPSELMMDAIESDETIVNDGGIDWLQLKIKQAYQGMIAEVDYEGIR